MDVDVFDRFPKQPQGMYPTEQPIPTIMGAVNMQPTMGGIQQGMIPSAFHAPGSWVPPQSQMVCMYDVKSLRYCMHYMVKDPITERLKKRP
jgi:hypothetical protein